MDFRFEQITLQEGFWHAMAEKNRTTTIHAVYNRFLETGRFEALKCSWREGMPNRPHIFWDSDVAKWIEGASYVLAKHPEKALENKIEELIDSVQQNQWEDGYINSYYTRFEPQNRFTVRGDHELYCIGHYIEAAIAYYYATGKRRF